jgi:putative spermidine/putrescine transport system substrate-binding protein
MIKAHMTRREFAGGALASMLIGSERASAQAQRKIVAVTWGAGVGSTWREAFGKPFAAKTATSFELAEAVDPSSQVRAQGASPQYNVFSGGYTDAVDLYREGLIETFAPSELPAIDGIPPEYRLTAPDGRLLGMPAYFTYYGIAINTDLVKPGEISSWKDLGDPRWKGKLAHNRPVYTSIYDLTACAYAEGGNEGSIEPGIPLFRKIAENALTAFSSMAQANQLLSRGEIAAVPYFASRVWQMKADGLPVDLIIPKEGALMLPYMAMVPKGTFGRSVANEFLNFIVEPKSQERMTEISGYLSLVSGVGISRESQRLLRISLEELRHRLINPDWFVLSKEHRKRADLILQLMSSSGR